MSTHSYVLVLTLFLALCAVNGHGKLLTGTCVKAKMAACNNVVKKVFMNAAADTQELRVYCNAMKALFLCVKNQLGDTQNPCRSDTLRKYHFIVLAYLGMDKIMGTCTQDVSEIKAKILDDLAPDSIEIAEDFVEEAFEDNPKVSECAKAAHHQCVKIFTGLEKQSDNLCFGVRDFIRCYQVKKCVTDKISVSFARLISKMSDELINAFEANSMCVVEKEL
ncbi:uncharacterized protein LOC116307639 [Actinia tenebrosa]|uniref:Uncharacterized protein LOC116307639 n=1 Tax=Actinia tenebrosa TaxID=6105 RepID=A0A6P8J2F5_ACTTE|nr:uncharacterized protein LOC116307639 [Actinia tenebrosa]